MVLLLAGGLIDRARAQASDVAALFPPPAQVATDYPDDVARYVALTALWDTLEAKSSAGASAIQKRSAYYAASQAIRQKYETQGAAAVADFDTKVRHLGFDGTMKRSVLARYHLEDGAAPVAAAKTGPPDLVFLRPIVAVVPLVAGTLVTMVLLIKRLMRNTAKYPAGSVPPRATGDLAHLPDGLRLVEVPGLEYHVELISGMVQDKGTGPLWLHTLDGRDIAWRLTNTAFQAQPGQLVSAIAQRRKKGTENLLLTYNHTTSQMAIQSETAHVARGTRAGWLATLVGSIGFGMVVYVLFPFQPKDDSMRQVIGPVIDWLEGMGIAALISAMIVLRRKMIVFRKRKKVFANNYTPRYTQFLLQLTPKLQRRFGVI